MKLVSTKTIAKVAAVATGLAMFTAVSTFALSAQAAALTSAQVSAIVSLLQSFGADSTTIANVQASLTGGTVTTTTTSSTSASCSFTRDLTNGVSGADVTCLQNALIAAGYSIPAGATGYFGAQTVAAVSAWQKAAGVSPAVGYFGAISRAHWTLGGGSSTTTTTTGTVPVGSGNGLKVSLSPTSPNGTVLVQGQGIGDIGDYVFANPTSAPITVTGLTFNRTGVSNDQTLDNVYLYQGVNRLTDSAGVSNSQFSFNNAAGLFVVPAGTTYTVSVRADIDKTNTSGQQVGSSLVSVSSTGTLDSTDSFPINSGYQTISAANLATVSFNTTTLPNVATTISPQSGYSVWQNTVSVSTNPVKLESMTFTNLGSIGSTGIGNFRLYVDGTQVGNAVASFDANRHITFDLSANPVLLSTQSHIIKVLADVTGGSSLTFELSLQRSSDALFVDSQLNQPVTPTVGNGNFSAVNTATVTVQAVNGATGISVSKDPSSQSNAIAAGASSVPLASFDLLASGEPVKVTDLYVFASTTGEVGSGGINNGKIFVNGVQVGSTRDINEGSTTPTDFGLGSSLIIPAGQTTVVTIYGDAQNAAGTNLASGSSVVVGLAPSTSNAQGQNSLQSAGVPYGTVAAQSVVGNAVTISTSSLTATKFSGYANQTIIPGSQNALLGEFTLAAGSTEGVNVNTIGVDVATGAQGVLQNLKLVDMSTGTQLGTIISTPSAGNNSFSLGSNLLIPQSGSKTVGVYGNVLSSATSSTVYNPLLSVDATATSGTGAQTGTTASLTPGNVTLQQITWNNGSLNVALGASNPVAANVIAGASSLEVGDFTFSANNSNYTIQKLEVDVPTNNVASALTSVSLKYTDVNGATQTATLSGASSVVSGTTTYQFTGLNAYVPSNSQSDISVWVSTPTISSGGSAISGTPIWVALDANNGFQAQDQSGNLTKSYGSYTGYMGLTSNSNPGYGTLVVRKSIPTFTMLTNPSPAPSSGQSLYQFSIAADPANSVDVDQVTFNVSTSTGVTLANFGLYDITSGSAVQVGSSVPTITGGLVTFNFGANPQQIGAGQSKTYELIPATVTGWTGSGTSVTVSLAQDTMYLANTDATTANTSKIVWSDRSATNHSTSTSDWTNGYLLKNFVNDVTSYTHS